MQCQQATFDTDRSYVTVRKYDIQLYDITDRRNQNLLTKQVLSKKHITPYGLDAQNSNIPGAIPPKWQKTCPRSGRTAIQNFTLISKAPAEKYVTVQNEKQKKT